MSKWGHAMRAALFGAAAYACAGANAGFAADMPFYPSEPTQQVKVEFGTGWYIRGDAAWAFDQAPVINPGLFDVTTRVRNNFSLDLGGGYKFNNWFRGDMTLGAYGAQPILVNNTAFAPGIIGGGLGDLNKYILLVNAYLDLGTWYGVTPFVGVGGGGDLINSSNSAGLAFFGMPNRSFNFAWALMGGVAYNLTDNAAVEVGYRYVHFGNYTGFDGIDGVIFNKNLSAQEVRVGLRYLVDFGSP